MSIPRDEISRHCRSRHWESFHLQGDPSGWLQPPIDLGLITSSSGWAAIVATYCPGKVAELSQLEVVTIQMGHPVHPNQSLIGRDGKKEEERDPSARVGDLDGCDRLT